MYSHVDSSFQGIMYKPNFNENLNLEKKFMKKRKQIFQSLNMRKPHKNKPLEDSLTVLSPSPENNKKSTQKLHLPEIYLYSKPKHQEIIPIEDNDKLVKQISKNLNFINKKIPVLNFDFNSIFDEDTKSIPYDSDVYKKELQMMNMIFGECGINLKPRDVMVLEGQKSKTQYIIFTNHPKHPQSLCCQSEIVIKHVQFLSPKKLYFAKEKSFEIPLKSFIALSCMKCSHEIMKIRPSLNVNSKVDHTVSDFEEQKRLLNYSKLISSGRFKKALINDESVEIMKGRKNPLVRSKTRMDKLHEISQSQKVKNPRYTEFKRQSRVKSYQGSLNLNPKSKSKELDVIISKRKHNISQVMVGKNV